MRILVDFGSFCLVFDSDPKEGANSFRRRKCFDPSWTRGLFAEAKRTNFEMRAPFRKTSPKKIIFCRVEPTFGDAPPGKTVGENGRK